ncbi:MAG: tetratricopeptide repeat protein [Prevotella sp.]
MESAEEQAQKEEEKRFDKLKYDGVRATRSGHADIAIHCFVEALKIHEDMEIRDYLARTLISADALPQAIEQLKILAQAAPDNTEVLKQWARVAYMQEDYATMEEICTKALAIDDKDAATLYLQAQATAGQGNAIQAIALLTQAITTDSRLATAYLMRARLLLSMGDVKGAAEDADHLTQTYGESEETLMLQAQVAHVQGNAAKALELYGKVTELNPFSVEAYKERGKVKYEQGDTKGAQEDMQKVLELNPNALANVNGEYSAEGVEHKVKQAYSYMNPLGL